MHKNIFITIAFVFVVMAMIFIGHGITGYVISESCCFPPDCEPENICTSAQPEVESPQPIYPGSNLFVGFFILAAALAVFMHAHRKKCL
jgi:hypothetical protein